MTHSNKILKALNGAQLALRCTRTFQTSLFNGKRVAIVGPADSAFNTGKGKYIDEFDWIVRINKAPYLLQDGQHKEDIGTRVDILVHSFFENEVSGGGVMDLLLYKKLGIQYLVKPITTWSGYRQIFNFYKKYQETYSTHTVSMMPFMEEFGFGKFRPTNGLCAIVSALQSGFTEVYITGFTFFKTAYVAGYRDSMKEASAARQYIDKASIHNPDFEFSIFKKLLNKYSERKIILDSVLNQIISQ